MSDEKKSDEKSKGNKNFISSIDYIFDENSQESEELAALIKPVRKRFKYTIYYNAIFMAVAYKYGQNVNTLMKRYFPNKMKGLVNLILFATLHSFAFCLLLIGGNCAVLGVNPFTFLKKHKAITDRIIEKEGLDISSISDLFKGPLKKISESKVDGKSFQETIKKNEEHKV